MKIVQISDLHFGMHRPELIQAFLQQLARLQPELIFISGDLTQRATPEQFYLFNEFLKQLPGTVLMVPGNHDIPLYPYQFFVRMFEPFKYYKRYVNSELLVHFENQEARILGVNSVNPYRVKKGRLSKETMKKIAAYFSTPFSGLNLLFFHHNFDYLEGAHKPLENYKELISYLKTSSINMVCAGHSHYANVNLIEKNNQEACVFLHAGSLLCTRSKDGLNSFFFLENTNQSCVIKLYSYQEANFIIHAEHYYQLNKQAPLTE